MKYFKLDKDKREIIIDKYKKYNVNVDILNLIIDLKCENDRLNNIINELEKYLIDKCKYIDENNPLANDKSYITYRTEQKLAYQCILEKLKELKDSD